MTPKVSIIVAAYNVANFIEATTRCFLEQTLDDLEIVIVNDCSTDNTREILDRVVNMYPHRKAQVKIIDHEKNCKIAQTRYDGLMAATGEYVIFCDADDLMDCGMAEKMYAKAKEADADIAVCDYIQCKEGEKKLMRHVPEGVEPTSEYLRWETINRMLPTFLWVKMIRRSLVADPRVIWPKTSLAEDVVVACQVFYFAKKVVYVPEPLYNYNFHTASVSHSFSEELMRRNVDWYSQNIKVIEEFVQREHLTEEFAKCLFRCKVRCRNYLLAILGKPGVRKLFLNTFPEINGVFFWGNKDFKPSYRERLWITGIKLGLYPKFQRRLNSKRFRPREGWR